MFGGKIRQRNSAPFVEPGAYRLYAARFGFVEEVPFGVRGQTRVGRGNLFILKSLGEGTYRAEVSGVLKDGFTVTRGEAGALEILVSSRGARVQGTVTDSDGLPLAGVWIVLVPELSQRENSPKVQNGEHRPIRTFRSARDSTWRLQTV